MEISDTDFIASKTDNELAEIAKCALHAAEKNTISFVVFSFFPA
jgi:hypothetical protein